MPRFVLLHHQCPPGYEKPSHWDLMLEQGTILKTWELRWLPLRWRTALGMPSAGDVPPVEQTTVPARQLADHRLAYLDYEGTIRGNRGEVRRCDSGTFELLNQVAGQLEIRLDGSILIGRVTLQRNKNEPQTWHLMVD